MIRAGLCERLNVAAGLGEHQMHVKRQIASFANARDHAGPHRKVRDEMPVHDIHMQQIRAAGLHARNRLAKTAEIRRQNRRSHQAAVLKFHFIQ